MKFLLDHDVSSHVSYALKAANHQVIQLSDALPRGSDDQTVFQKAYELDCIMVTCNRDDFIELATKFHFRGLIIVIRRNPPVLEGRRVLRLLSRADESGILGNINFA